MRTDCLGNQRATVAGSQPSQKPRPGAAGAMGPWRELTHFHAMPASKCAQTGTTPRDEWSSAARFWDRVIHKSRQRSGFGKHGPTIRARSGH